MKGDRLGEFEELTLLALRATDAPAYGVPVQQFLERMSGRNITMGAVYAALDRLEQKGLVRSSMSEATPQRGGKAKRIYEVTAEGMRTVRDLRSMRDRIWRAIEER